MKTLTVANEARLQKALSQLYRFNNGTVMSLGQYLEENAWKLSECEESKIQYKRVGYKPKLAIMGISRTRGHR